jgi:hypothetical protein
MLATLVTGCGPMAELGLVKPKEHAGVVHEYSQGGGHANLYWIDTPAGPVMVDVPLREGDAKKLRADLPRPYRIYITEAKPDRYGSLAVMRKPDVPAFTTPAIATEIQAHGDQRLLSWHNKYDDVPRHVDAPSPAIEERIRDMVGEVELELLPLGPAEAEASLAIFIPKTGELIAGDVVGGHEHLDLTWGRSKVWQDRIAELKALEPKIVYPGHGTGGGPELLDATLDYLKFFHDAVAQKVKQGAPARITKSDAAEVKREILAKYPKLGRPELVEKGITAEYAVQLAELAPAPAGAPGSEGGTPAAGGTPAGTTTATNTASVKESQSGSGSSAVNDLLGGEDKGKKKKGKK